MAQLFDISMLGDKALERKLRRLADKVQVKVVGSALGKSRTRTKRAILATMDSGFFKEPTGELRESFKKTKLKSSKRRGVIRRSIAQPETAEEAIKMNSVEYGHTTPQGGFVQPKPFIRSTVNAIEDEELRRIGKDIGSGIEQAAKR